MSESIYEKPEYFTNREISWLGFKQQSPFRGKG